MARSGPLRRRLLTVARRLSTVYGRPRRRRSDPMDTLVETVLSQNTSDVNSARAFRSLKAAFPTWEAMARARPARLERAIRVGGLARTKSRRLVRLLADLRARGGESPRRGGDFDLRGLRRLPRAEADASLRGLTGVGPKTRACVLLFACGQPAFPVDTHVHRIVRRLGLVPDGATAERAHALLDPAVPAMRALDLHLNLIRLGREVCRPRAPRCLACPLRSHCRFARRGCP
ncbi:MAG: endonuclease III [Acidobacteria bacterium]|nr:endonuclease III [Acidobacteriota bacterium]